jgi:hypothetical protein
VAPDGRSLCAGCAAWVRQEFRRGKWWTMERHPMESLESVQNEPVPDDEAREVPA